MSRRRALTDEQAILARSQYLRGKVNTVKRICERFGISRDTLRRYARTPK
jgi:uncharacterized protein YjcR